ncbi:condensation domain-containing protein [Tengunoibacter tsumagoiensis]|uniref:Condensation domain-containing protein n=1 Tax=Tengunoibacter tsumagoiensis TaxID=2014871 RepID=A0A402A641_9CHLR|nr:condensation domain-containing protein [Tengunoibacter tsumagoiensis]GCE14617.1 hypothetical protein KTT_44760 [Tengunoibacter tsumagoiensis]
MSTSSSDNSQRLASLSPAKKALLEQLLQKPRPATTSRHIQRRTESGPAPLSYIQEHLWVTPTIEPIAVLIDGDIQLAWLEQAFHELIQRHATLRTTYTRGSDGRPVQIIQEKMAFELPLEDVEAWPEAERFERAMEQLNQESRSLTIDLEKGPVLLAKIFRFTEQQHLLFVVIPGLITDGWAQVVFFRDLAALYTAQAEGKPATIQDLSIQYADFASWQRQTLPFERYHTFWKARLEDRPRLILPTDLPRESVTSYRESRVSVEVHPQTVEQIREFCRAQNVTLFLFFFTLFHLLMHHFTGQSEIVIGIEISSRNRPETEDLIGIFTHILPVRISLVGEHLTFLDLLQRVRAEAADVYAHQGIPVGRLIELCDPERDLQREPIISATVAYLNEQTLLSARQTTAISFKPYRLADEEEQEDLNLQIFDIPRGLGLVLVYNIGLFHRSTIEDLLGRYTSLLQKVLAQPHVEVKDLLQSVVEGGTMWSGSPRPS